MKVPQFDKWSQELWNQYIHKLDRKTHVYENWKYEGQEERRIHTKKQSFNHNQKSIELREHQNNMKLLNEYFTLVDNRHKSSLNAKMGNQFYLIGTHIDIKV
jgi:hypothetical protein